MTLTIIVPIHNAAKELESCLQALERNVCADDQIVLIDDASTDAQIPQLLNKFAQQTQAEHRRHDTNLGFVQTVNQAASDVTGDFVLLNSDTQVTKGWASALRRCAAADERIATATPFSNNAEICSLPAFCQSNPIPPEPDKVAEAIHACAPPSYPELPTGVGFCMYVRGQAWREIGGFSTEFGRGYGEENDFCRRAFAAGWRNVLCDDAYVVHAGGASFGELGIRAGGDNAVRLNQRHPDYERLVAQFIADDRLAERRAEILSECQRRNILLPSA